MIAIIDYDAGNVKSVQNALKKLGFEAVITSDIETIKNADKVIFPGVGEASSAMKKLQGKRFRCSHSEFKTTCFGNLSRNATDV